MGFFDWLDPPKKRRPRTTRYTSERVFLSVGGYDRHGRYWGIGERLYRVTDSETGKEKHVRAVSGKSARSIAAREKAGWR